MPTLTLRARARPPPAARLSPPRSPYGHRGKADEALRHELPGVSHVLERRDLQVAALAEHHFRSDARGGEGRGVVAEASIAGRLARGLEQMPLEHLWRLRGPQPVARQLLGRRAGLVRAAHRAG